MSGNSIKKIAFSSGIGSGVGILISCAVIVLIAAILAAADIPAMMIAPSVVFAVALGGFSGGFCSARLNGEKGLFCGIVSGSIFFMVLFLAGVIFAENSFGTEGIIKTVMVMISSSLGGITGVNYIKRK